ncbi:MAG: serine O-acetyltransferase EpsC [Anaeromyxobacteraceae bacterium]
MSEVKQEGVDIRAIVEELRLDAVGPTGLPGGRAILPSRDAVIQIVEDLRSVFFPGYFGTADVRAESLHFFLGATLERTMRALEEQVRRAVAFVERHDYFTCDHCAQTSQRVATGFLSKVPSIRRLLASDVEAAYEGDPALKNRDEAIIAYPGMMAITNQRIAHELHVLGVPLLPRIMTEHAHALTGIDIHPGARIGERFFIDHGTGVVIGETCIIGNRVRIYQGVTLGAKSFPLDEHGKPIKGIDRHPVVEDDVVIYSGATVLGRIVVGKGSSIGGNVWLTHAVPPGSNITQAAAK